MRVIDQIVDFLARLVMGVSAIAVFGVTFAQVLCRYVLKSPPTLEPGYPPPCLYLSSILGRRLVCPRQEPSECRRNPYLSAQ